MAAISREINAVLLIFCKNADKIVINVAITTRETNNDRSECSMFCCCSTKVEADNPDGSNPIHIPKLTPASKATTIMFKNRTNGVVIINLYNVDHKTIYKII
jgi:hypothetical protein